MIAYFFGIISICHAWTKNTADNPRTKHADAEYLQYGAHAGLFVTQRLRLFG